MERIEDLCCYYIAFLRSVGLIHQNNHWLVKGKNSYGNHLLFERIYKSAQEDSDMAAERFIGVFGEEILNLNMQAGLIGKMLGKFSEERDLLGSSLKAENEFLEFSEHFNETLKKEDKLTLGVEDMIAAISSSRESSIYLLKQASSDESEVSESQVVARTNLWKKLKKESAKKKR